VSWCGAISGYDLRIGMAENYLEWAQDADGRSAAYAALSRAVAADRTILAFLATLPRPKQQPNLLFAAARYLLGQPADHERLHDLVSRDPAALTRVMLARRTQTNEPARCATILPALALLPEPLALIEVGASAGLTLLFDRYSYDYAGHRVVGTDPQAPVLRCATRGPVPLPSRVPAITWRAGLDLNPLDVRDDNDVHWLSCLVWPGEGDREQRLAGAIATARRDPPVISGGDLLTDLPALAAQAPADATLVIFHSAVLAYLSAEERRTVVDIMRGLPATWLSNEAPGVIPDVAVPAHQGRPFALIRDGHDVLALTDGHGDWVQWLG
jgi:hypothetical protein